MSCQYHKDYDPASGEPTAKLHLNDYEGRDSGYPCPYCWQARANWLITPVPRTLPDYIAELEATHGIYFGSRGLGSDSVPCCFVCGGDTGSLSSNISGFVKSKDDGKLVVAMLDNRARLDFREHEPDWIQVKLGVCKEHQDNLEELHRVITSTGCLGRINKTKIDQAKNYLKEGI